MLYILLGIYYLMSAYELFMVVYCILSWIPPLYETKLFRFFHAGANVYLRPFHGLIVIGRIDFTTLIGFFIYGFAQRCLGNYIMMLANMQNAL